MLCESLSSSFSEISNCDIVLIAVPKIGNQNLENRLNCRSRKFVRKNEFMLYADSLDSLAPLHFIENLRIVLRNGISCLKLEETMLKVDNLQFYPFLFGHESNL